jgi:hypothetical protein
MFFIALFYLSLNRFTASRGPSFILAYVEGLWSLTAVLVVGGRMPLS